MHLVVLYCVTELVLSQQLLPLTLWRQLFAQTVYDFSLRFPSFWLKLEEVCFLSVFKLWIQKAVLLVPGESY